MQKGGGEEEEEEEEEERREGRNTAPHDKRLLLVLRILRTEAGYYLSLPVSLEFIVLADAERERERVIESIRERGMLPKSVNESQAKDYIFIIVISVSF